MILRRGARLRRPLPVAVVALVALLVGSAAPASAGVLVGTYLDGQGSATVSGLTRAKATVSAAWNGTNTTMGMELGLRNATGSATANETVRLRGGTFTCTAGLASCSIDDAGGLGTYGRFKLTFTATKPKVTRNITCPGSDTVYGTTVGRKGVLTGTLRIETKSSKLGVIRNSGSGHRVPASMPFTVTRSTYSGVGCPAVPAQCKEFVSLRITDYAISANRDYTGAKRGYTFFFRDLPSVDPDIDRSVYVVAKGPGTAALTVPKATLASATIGTQISSPFVTGALTFTPSSGLLDTTNFGCAAQERSGTLAGSITWKTPGRAKLVQAVSAIAVIDHADGVAP